MQPIKPFFLVQGSIQLKMKKTLVAFLIILAQTLNAQNKQIENKWLVILSGFKSLEEAEANQSKYKFKTIVLNSSDYTNLNPGWFINCIPYTFKKDATIRSKGLKRRNTNNYIKFSGTRKDAINNHHLVYHNKYLLLDIPLEHNAIKEIIGYEEVKYETFLTRAICKKNFIPKKIKNMLNSEVSIYNAHGEQTTAKIIGFNVISIMNPFWGTINQWKFNNTPPQEIAQELIDLTHTHEPPEHDGLMLAGILDTPSDFDAVIALPNNLENFDDFLFFSSFKSYNSLLSPVLPDIISEKKFMNMIYKTDSYKKNIPTESDIFQKDTLTIYSSQEETFIYYNMVVWGEENYRNISFLWDQKNNKLHELNILKDADSFEFIPLFSPQKSGELIGFVKKDRNSLQSFIKQNKWLLKKSMKHHITFSD